MLNLSFSNTHLSQEEFQVLPPMSTPLPQPAQAPSPTRTPLAMAPSCLSAHRYFTPLAFCATHIIISIMASSNAGPVWKIPTAATPDQANPRSRRIRTTAGGEIALFQPCPTLRSHSSRAERVVSAERWPKKGPTMIIIATYQLCSYLILQACSTCVSTKAV